MKLFTTLFCFVSLFVTPLHAEIKLDPKNNLFVPSKVPSCGLTSSNNNRIERIKNYLSNVTTHEIPWGGAVHIGTFKGKDIFIVSAPVGSGSGLVFTELYAAGAQYILRYGSDDTPNPGQSDETLVKIVDEADNLIGFEQASGIPETKRGHIIKASPILVAALQKEAEKRQVKTSLNICHHLENYHGFRTPDIYPEERALNLHNIRKSIKRDDKGESWDMETAVLFRVAKDFGRHAATVLQTVDKRDPSALGPYEGENLKRAREIEDKIFIDFVLTTLANMDQ